MTLTLTKVAANTATVTIPVGEDTLNIVYYPSRVTGKLVAQIDEGTDELTQSLVTLIKSWDLYEDDTQTTLVAIDAEHLDMLGIALEVQIGLAILGDIRMGEASATPA